MKRTDDCLYFRDLSDSCQRDMIHRWNVSGKLDLVHAVNNGIDVVIGGYYVDEKDEGIEA